MDEGERVNILKLYIYIYIYLYYQMLSCVRLFVTPWTAALQASLSISNSWSLLRLSPSSW